MKLYMQQHGDTVAGRKIELIIRDDGGVADTARRLIQEMIVNDKVDVVGIGITPTALAIAPLVTEAKKATLVMSSGASITTTKSPVFRARRLSAQPAVVDHGRMGGQERQQARRHPGQRLGARHRSGDGVQDPLHPGRRRDHRIDPHSARQSRLRAVPAAHRDLKPDTAFIYFPGTQAPIFAKQFAERGLGKSGIKIIGPGDLTDDDDLNNMGDQMLGMITAGPYSAAHNSRAQQGLCRGHREGRATSGRISSRSAAMTACICSTRR